MIYPVKRFGKNYPLALWLAEEIYHEKQVVAVYNWEWIIGKCVTDKSWW